MSQDDSRSVQQQRLGNWFEANWRVLISFVQIRMGSGTASVDGADAEDIVHSILERLLSREVRLPADEMELKKFIFTCLMHKLIDAIRNSARKSKKETQPGEGIEEIPSETQEDWPSSAMTKFMTDLKSCLEEFRIAGGKRQYADLVASLEIIYEEPLVVSIEGTSGKSDDPIDRTMANRMKANLCLAKPVLKKCLKQKGSTPEQLREL